MKKAVSLLVILAFVLCSILKAQPNFQILTSEADSLRQEGDLRAALDAYKRMYLKDCSNETNIYNYACALSLDRQNDSAFKYLNLSIDLYTSENCLTDPDFLPLRKDNRWSSFENKVIKLIEAQSQKPYKDIDYAKHLWLMNAIDQKHYFDIHVAERKIGMHSTVVIAMWEMKEELNKQNQTELIELIDKKGWPKISEVGARAAAAAFLIIQHASTELQKKYLPIIENLCKQNEANWQNYALMYDRVQIADNKPQRYGSQINYNEPLKKYELYPLEDESRVEEWRKSVGLNSLIDYAAMWNIKFEPKINPIKP